MKIAYAPTTMYRKDEAEEAFKHVSDAGYDGIELLPSIYCRNSDIQVKKMKTLMKNYKLELACLPTLHLRDKKSLSFVKKVIDVCRELETEYIFFAPPTKNECKWENYIEYARSACKYAENAGIVLTVHHHAGTIVETLNETLAMIKQVNSSALGVCFDTGHYALFEDNLKVCVKKLVGLIEYVHLKDLASRRKKMKIRREELVLGTPYYSNIAKEFTDLGEGTLDFEEVLRSLKETGYDGWLTVEMEGPRVGRGERAIKNSKYLTSILQNL
jgi:sugar phosphate isomerase/epimerase